MTNGNTAKQKTKPARVPKKPGDHGWQSHKSSTTRELIFKSTVQCIVEYGYANTTTTRIAEKAGLSRGATLHHFSSHMDIIRASVEYLHQKRLKAFRKAVENLPEGGNRVRMAAESYRNHVMHPLFVAFFELSVAARSDTELAAVLRPAQEAFDNALYETTMELFPEWKQDPQALELAMDLSQKLMEGMLICDLTHSQNFDREALLDFLEASLRSLLPQN
ncbi:MAG: TetR/AcrR family transcriptional regulator [Gammaproteobacteria bacterium]